MRNITPEEAKELLNSVGLTIGSWNEVLDVKCSSGYLTFQAPKLGSELYVACQHLVQWLSIEEWVIIQIDNSTNALDDEIEFLRGTFEMNISFKDEGNRTFMLVGDDLRAKTAALMYFFLVFEWHAYAISATSKYGKRLGLQDGMVYFFGSHRDLDNAGRLVDGLKRSPLSIARIS